MTPDVEMTEPEQVHSLETQFEHAEEIVASLSSNASPDTAMQAFRSIIDYSEDDATLEQVQRVKEHSIYKLAQLYIQFGREKELATLLQSLRPLFVTLARAKTGKIGAKKIWVCILARDSILTLSPYVYSPDGD
ncbi:hypothetical protein PsorP6_016653 [Peronosclerospora sorghi]|uniref:Uncharacterized protein n=1 Tax=Peronosclerospora sorghi TaxID=230839 RepID=A0ACC0VQE7_9STRA|nr:hypothetical protein PsorP6_016653 [Peronosclerospora sorghi]